MNISVQSKTEYDQLTICYTVISAIEFVRFITYPPTLALATSSGFVGKYGEPLDACNSFCRVHMNPGPINAGETAFTLIPCGARSYNSFR